MNRVWYFLMRRVYPREGWVYDHVPAYREWWGERDRQRERRLFREWRASGYVRAAALIGCGHAVAAVTFNKPWLWLAAALFPFLGVVEHEKAALRRKYEDAT